MRLSFSVYVSPVFTGYTKLVVCKRFFNVHTPQERGKKFAVSRGPWRRVPLPWLRTHTDLRQHFFSKGLSTYGTHWTMIQYVPVPVPVATVDCRRL